MGTVRILRIDPHHLWGWLWFKLPAHLFNEWINDVTATARTTTTRIESIWGSCFKLISFRWRHGWWWWWCKCAFNYVQAYFFKWTTHSLQLFLLGKWTIHSLVFSYLRNFQSNHKKLQQINLKNYPSCTRCPDSNTQLLPHEVPPVTTRPGRLSSFPSSSHCTDKYYCHKNCFGFERFWKQLSAHCARANVLYMFLSTLIIEGIQWLCWLNIQGMTSRNYSYNKSKIEERQTDRLNIIYKCQFYCLGSTGIDCLVVAGQKKFKLPSKKP